MRLPETPETRAEYAAVLRRDAATIEANLHRIQASQHAAMLMLAQEYYSLAEQLDPPGS